MKKIIFGFVFSMLAASAQAGLIAQYDYLQADTTLQVSGTEISASTVGTGFSASTFLLNNTDNTAAAFGNHFYHNGWDATFNANKYYELSLSSTDAFSFSNVEFSLEEVGGSAATFWLRTSLDSFASDIATGMFSAGLVTDFDINLSSLGVINSPISFRWYLADDSTAGFANHQCDAGPTFDAGCGLSDVGLDLTFYGDAMSVPEPGSFALFMLGLAGFGVRLRLRKSA